MGEIGNIWQLDIDHGGHWCSAPNIAAAVPVDTEYNCASPSHCWEASLFMIKCNVSRVGHAISEMIIEEHTSFSDCERLWSTFPAGSCWMHIMGAKLLRAVCKRSNLQPIPTWYLGKGGMDSRM